MDENKNELEEFDLEDILKEFHDDSQDSAPEEPSPAEPAISETAEDEPVPVSLPELDLSTPQEEPEDLDALKSLADLNFSLHTPEEQPEDASAEPDDAPALEGDTVRFAPITDAQLDQALADLESE